MSAAIRSGAVRSTGRSLTLGLFGRMLLVFAAAAIATGGLAWAVAQEQVDATYDQQMRLGARTAFALTEEERAEGRAAGSGAGPLLSAEDRDALRALADWPLYRIWRDGRLSETGGPPARADAPAPAKPGFATRPLAGAPWRFYDQAFAPGVWVEVGQPTALRRAVVAGIAVKLAGPLLAVFPLVAVLLYASVLSGLKVLRSGVEGVARQSALNLTPVETARWPADLDGLAQTINTLLERLAAAVARERRFMDAAAHHLRTPLASIRLEAQQLADAADLGEARATGQTLTGAVDRAAVLVDQLLLLARLDAAASEGEAVDITLETALAIADLSSAADQKGVEVTLTAVPLTVRSQPGLVRAMTAALLDNALRHTPVGGEVAVTLEGADGRGRLSVVDTGEGLTEAEAQAAFERFRQGAGLRGAGGLGLAIVAEVAKGLGGEARLGPRIDGRPGLAAEVAFPIILLPSQSLPETDGQPA